MTGLPHKGINAELPSPSPAGLVRTLTPFVTLVVPVYNEENSLEPFLAAVTAVFAPLGLRYELLFINDGSTDGTLPRLVTLSTTNSQVRVVNLSRNFSKEAALTAGLDHALGDVVVPIDVDLQDPPELIVRFIELWREGYDVVYGVRSNRAGDHLLKRWSSAVFYKIFNSLSPMKIPVNVGDFRLVDRRIVEVLKILPERNRFMKGLFAWVGFRSIAVPYIRPARKVGTSKWNYWRLWNFALDGLFGFSSLPLRIWINVGMFVAVSSFLFAGVIVLKVFIYGIAVPGYATLMTAILFLGGVQLISLGIIGEYLGRLFIEVKRRPVYMVEGLYQSGARAADNKP